MNGWLIYDAEGRIRNKWFINRLISSAAEHRTELRLIEAEKLVYGIKDGNIAFCMEGVKVPLPDFALCRTIFPLLSQMLERAGVKVYNSALVSEICNDKRKTHAFFAGKGVLMADTAFCDKGCFSPDNYRYPVILKSTDGHGGKEVYWVNSPEEALQALKRFEGKGFLLQRPVKPGEDVRVYLLNGRILAAVKRRSGSDFRSNFSLGGKAELIVPTAEMKRVTELVCAELHPMFVGIDFVFNETGEPMLNEIEDVVGTRMLYILTEIQAADFLIQEILGDLSERA